MTLVLQMTPDQWHTLVMCFGLGFLFGFVLPR